MKQYALFIDGNPISYTFCGPSDLADVFGYLKKYKYISPGETWCCTIYENRFNYHYDTITNKWVKNIVNVEENHISRKSNKKRKSDRDVFR